MKNELTKILTKLRRLLPEITRRYNVSSIGVFGSFVRNEQNNNSDLDLLVTFSKTPSLIKFIELKNFLSDNLNINVDLVMKDSLKPRIKHSITSDALAI